MSTIPTNITSTLWDYIFVGGGLVASVISHRLLESDPHLKILVVEAGPNANDRSDIVWPNSNNLIGGDFDWKDVTVKQSNLDDRILSYSLGKALGGGTVINAGGWVRGDQFDLDTWGSIVDDKRWSYDGLLPYLKKSEQFWSKDINSDQHGQSGPCFVQSVTSTNREFPLRDIVLQSWAELGINPRPGLDANAGNPLGVGELQENKVNGRREIAAARYSLDGITVLTDTQVARVIIDNKGPGQSPTAVGIALADGSEIRGHETILSAGAIRTPQLLKLSGIGPAEELKKHGIPVVLDNPEVGENLADHGLFRFGYKVKDPSAGWALGSPNQLFTQEQYGWGTPADFVVSTDVSKKGLAAAIAEDEGKAPDPSVHPLLSRERTFNEHVFIYAGAADGSVVSFATFTMLTTSRGSVKLASSNIQDAPLIDPNFLNTAVDRYVAREAVKLQVKFAASNATAIGRDILDGEVGETGFDETLTVDSTDDYIDARLRSILGTGYHPMGTAAMGKVVDQDLRVKGINSLRVVDASVIPIVVTGHLQVSLYALGEQASAIISAERNQRRG
ncbi:putative GMC oxidoreductase [Camillea tinctor]|nr:putative GMC oxidoreductase [Camillea tinctor]